MGSSNCEASIEYVLRRYKGMYDAQCELMEESFERMDQLLSREIARERELLEDDIAAQRLEDWKILGEETYDMAGEEIVFGNAFFRRLIRRSNLVTIISYLESSLTEITKLLLHETNARRVGTGPGLRLRDFGHGNVCQMCRTALTRYIGISDDQSLYNSLQHFMKIRNLVVHQGGYISLIYEDGQFLPEENTTRKLLEKLESKGLTFSKSGELIVETQLYQSLLITVRDYLCDTLDRAAEHFTKPKAI